MIISEDNPSSPTKSSLSPLQIGVEPRDRSPGPAPPSYNVATSTSITQSPLSISPESPLLPYHSSTQYPIGAHNIPYKYVTEEEQRHASRRARWRFVKALGVAALCYLVLMAWVSATFGVGINFVSSLISLLVTNMNGFLLASNWRPYFCSNATTPTSATVTAIPSKQSE